MVKDSGNESFGKLFTERNWQIVDAVKQIADESKRSAAQVAINWVVNRPGITSTIIGATKLNQLKDNIGALEFSLSEAHLGKLDEVSAPPTIHPYVFFGAQMQSMITGGVKVHGWSEQEHAVLAR